MSTLRPFTALPDLEELMANPQLAAELPAAAAGILLSRCAGVIARYEALRDSLRLRVASGAVRPVADDGMRLLGTEEVATLLGRSKSWVEHHTSDLPPRRSLVGEPVWLKRDVEKWLSSLPGYAAKARGRPSSNGKA